MAQTYYEVLGVAENATDQAIEAAFKSKAKEIHPDRVGSGSPYLQKVAAEAFKELSEGRSVLLDPAKRQKYDSALAYMRGSPSASTDTPPPPSPQSSAPGGGQRKDTRTSPQPQVMKQRSNTKFAIAFLIGLLGCLFFLTALIGNDRTSVTGVTSKPVSNVAKPKATEELRPGIDLSSDARSAHTEVNPLKPDFSGLSTHEHQSIQAVCSNAKYVQEPAAYDRCFNRQLATSGSAPSHHDLSGLSTDELVSIQAVCSDAISLQGPPAYDRCLNRQLASLASAPELPDLSGLSTDELQSIQGACSNAKYLEGPAAYDRCLVRQLNLPTNRQQ
jgi:hypothetical protein